MSSTAITAAVVVGVLTSLCLCATLGWGNMPQAVANSNAENMWGGECDKCCKKTTCSDCRRCLPVYLSDGRFLGYAKWTIKETVYYCGSWGGKGKFCVEDHYQPCRTGGVGYRDKECKQKNPEPNGVSIPCQVPGCNGGIASKSDWCRGNP